MAQVGRATGAALGPVKGDQETLLRAPAGFPLLDVSYCRAQGGPPAPAETGVFCCLRVPREGELSLTRYYGLMAALGPAGLGQEREGLSCCLCRSRTGRGRWVSSLQGWDEVAFPSENLGVFFVKDVKQGSPDWLTQKVTCGFGLLIVPSSSLLDPKL